MPSAVLAAGLNASGPETAVFWILAPIAVIFALGMVFSRHTVHAALMLGGVMLILAVFYAAQDAPFLAFVQVIVYTGAVMMLFLFVLMLIGVDTKDSLAETLRGQRFAGVVAAIGFLLLLFTGIVNAGIKVSKGLHAVNHPDGEATRGVQNAGGNVYQIARLLFDRYVFAFEATSALLITAALGAMVLAHRQRHAPKATQRELMQQRFKFGTHPTPLPGPGVYARHNAVDTPALLPDGSPSPLSVPLSVELVSQKHGRDPRPAELGSSAAAHHPASGKGQSE
jgi:NADH-quinone oxidoreductase subunit J